MTLIFIHIPVILQKGDVLIDDNLYSIIINKSLLFRILYRIHQINYFDNSFNVYT